MPNDEMLIQRTEAWLEWVTESWERERHWLDTLSQLEYVGCRKILKSVAYQDVNFEVLQHIAEEASHALLLKGLCDGETPDRRSWGDNPFSAAGWKYFQTLDAGVSASLTSSERPYVWVSWAIEQRVLRLYPAYMARTRQERVKRVLGQVLAQERRHGRQFEEATLQAAHRDGALELEARLWSELLEDWDAAKRWF